MEDEIKKTGYEYDLKDIETKEVSLVDRAANKRKFLIVKNVGGKNQMGNELELGLEEGNKAMIPAPVLNAVIKMTQSSIEKLISLASKLEGMQGTAKEDTEKQEKENPIPKDIADEFKSIISILESILNKYPSATQKKEDSAESSEKVSKEASEDSLVVKEFGELFNNLSKKLDDLKVAVEKFSLKEKTEMDNAEKEKEVKKEEPKKEEAKKEEVKVEAVNKAEIISEMKKMLDDRATDLVKLFKEAAAEEFKPLFERVSAIETTLGGSKGNTESKESKEYERNYGMQENEPAINDEANPFSSMFKVIS